MSSEVICGDGSGWVSRDEAGVDGCPEVRRRDEAMSFEAEPANSSSNLDQGHG